MTEDAAGDWSFELELETELVFVVGGSVGRDGVIEVVEEEGLWLLEVEVGWMKGSREHFDTR